MVDITILPVFPRLKRLDHRVLRFVEVFGGMSVFGVIAAADMPARKTEPQMDPAISRFQAFFTAFRGFRGNVGRRFFQMFAQYTHTF